MMDRAAGDPARPSAQARLVARSRGDERGARDDARAVPDDERAERLAGARRGARATAGTTTRSTSGRRSGSGRTIARGRDERAPAARPSRPATTRVRPRRVDDARRAGSCERPNRSSASRSRSRCASVGEPSTATVTPTPRDCAKRDLRPAGGRRVAGLPGDEAARAADEVVGRLDHPSVREPRARHAGVAADRTARGARRGAAGGVPRRRVVAGLVEPVRVAVVRAGEPELARLGVHQRDEALDAAAGGDRERGRGVVRARHERADRRGRAP